MKLSKLLVLVPLAACSSQPSKQESLQVFAAATAAMSSAQARAVTDAQQPGVIQAPAVLTLDFAGPCTLGGTVAVTGSYDGDGTDSRAAFDLTASFDGCKEPQGTLDGSLRWTSTANGTSFSATMTGELDWSGAGGESASCDFDLSLSVDPQRVSYAGSMCGYDLQTELGIQTDL